MRFRFHAFSPGHLVVLAGVIALAAALAVIHRRQPGAGKSIRMGLALVMLLTTASYYGNLVVQSVPIFPGHLPLELCDASLWMTMLALVMMKPAVFDVAYYWTMGGATMALLTPNLSEPTKFEAAEFFLGHGLTVAAILYLVWSRQARPRPWSVVRAMAAANAFAVIAGTMDWAFKTDYMFLRAKPQETTLLSALGPWPWYVLSAEGVGFVLFGLLYLPFWRRPRPGNNSLEDKEARATTMV